MLKIGDFSKLSRISIRMLRHYDDMGLLTPLTTDAFSGYRYYSEAQLPVANRIAVLKNMGFSLATVVEIMKNYDDPEALSRFLVVKQAEVQTEAEEVERRLLLLETAIRRLREDGTMMKYDVTVKTMPERYVASVRKVIPAYDQEGILWGVLMQETAHMGLQFAEPCNSLALFHDEGYKEGDVDVEVQMTVKGSYKNTEHVVFKTMPAVEIASATYNGSYEQMTAVNQAVASWVQEHDYEFDDMMFCIYHVSPGQTEDPDEYVTEVCYAVKKK